MCHVPHTLCLPVTVATPTLCCPPKPLVFRSTLYDTDADMEADVERELRGCEDNEAPTYGALLAVARPLGLEHKRRDRHRHAETKAGTETQLSRG